jgi:hypothetical protein
MFRDPCRSGKTNSLFNSNKTELPPDKVGESHDGVEADVLFRVIQSFPEQHQEILSSDGKNIFHSAILAFETWAGN